MHGANEGSAIFIFFVVLMGVYALLFGYLIANYVLTSLAVYRIADKRRIQNPWLAWIPYANYWIIGSIADEYDARNGLQRKWRVVLLGLSIIGIACYILIYIFIFLMYFTLFLNVIQNGATESQIVTTVFPLFIPVIIIYFLFFVFSAALMVCTDICYYKIFESIVPEKAVKYFLFFFMIPLAGPICLLKCSKLCPELVENAPEPALPPVLPDTDPYRPCEPTE